MWVRTEPGELINLEHSHLIHVVESGAPKFHIEVIAMIGADKHIVAHLPYSADGRKAAKDYIDALCQGLTRAGKLANLPQHPRPHGK